MKKKYNVVFQVIGTVILFAFILDLIILSAAILQIANGQPTEHIPFWDAQIRFIIHLI